MIFQELLGILIQETFLGLKNSFNLWSAPLILFQFASRLKLVETASISMCILVTMKSYPISWEDRFHWKTWRSLMASTVPTLCL